MSEENLAKLKEVKMVFENPNVIEYTAPSELRVSELAGMLVSALRTSEAGVVHAALIDNNNKTRFVIAIAEYVSADNNRDLLNGIKEMTHAIRHDKTFWVEVDE